MFHMTSEICYRSEGAYAVSIAKPGSHVSKPYVNMLASANQESGCHFEIRRYGRRRSLLGQSNRIASLMSICAS